jgi:hypothetical protein
VPGVGRYADAVELIGAPIIRRRRRVPRSGSRAE